MKKLLLRSAMALCALFGAHTASAYNAVIPTGGLGTATNLASVDDLTDGKYYFIYDDNSVNNRNAFRYDNGYSVLGTHVADDAVTNQLNASHAWLCKKNSDGTFSFQNVQSGRWIGAIPTNANVDEVLTVADENSKGSYTITKNEDGSFKIANGNRMWDGLDVDYRLCTWHEGSGHPMKFYEISVDKGNATEAWAVTYTFPEVQGHPLTVRKLLANGANAAQNVPTVEFFTPSGLQGTNTTVGEGNLTFTVNGTWAFPVNFNKVYRLMFKPGTRSNCLVLKDDGKVVAGGTNDTEGTNTTTAEKYLWYFNYEDINPIKGHFIVTMHSLAKADNNYIQFGATDNKQGTNVTSKAQFTSLEIEKAGDSGATQAGDFIFRVASTVDNYSNDRGGYCSTWKSSVGKNDGSYFRLSEMTDADFTFLSPYNADEDISAAQTNPNAANIRELFAQIADRSADVAPIVAKAQSFIDLGFCEPEAIAAWQAAIPQEGEWVGAKKIASLTAAYNELTQAASKTVDGVHVYLEAVKEADKYMVPTEALTHLQRGDKDGKAAFTLKHADEHGFYLFNEYTNKYAKSKGTSNQVELVAFPSDATVYSIKVHDAATAKYAFSAYGHTGYAEFLHTNAQAVVSWEAGDNSSWYITLASDDEAANEHLAGGKAHYQTVKTAYETANYSDYTVGTAFGNVNLFNDGCEAAMNLTESNTVAEKRAGAEKLWASYQGIRQPDKGKLYRISCTYTANNQTYTRYLSGTHSGNSINMMEDAQGNQLEDVFYLDEENRLVSVTDGLVLGQFRASDGNNSWKTVLASSDRASHVEFVASTYQKGKYLISTYGTNNRHIYGANATVNCGGADANGYTWDLHEVAWLPIQGSNNEYCTYVAPVALTLKSGVSALNPTLTEDGYVSFESVKGIVNSVLPANTPVVLRINTTDKDASNGLVYLKVTSSNAAPIATNMAGSELAKAIPSGANYVGLNTFGAFVPLSGNTPGFKAYMETELPGYFAIHYDVFDQILADGKVYAIKNNDTANNRGYLVYKNGDNHLSTSNKLSYNNADADTQAQTNANFHWVVIKDAEGDAFLYNIGVKKFAAAYEVNTAWNNSEFYWHFSDIPTAVNLQFAGAAPTANAANAVVNIVGGENTQGTNVAGMMVINGQAYPVPGVSGNGGNPSDGCLFKFIEITNPEQPTDMPTAADIAAIKADMHANYTAAKNYIANYRAVNAETLVGHYNEEGHTLFAQNFVTHDDAVKAQKKHYALLRAKNAAGNNINTFEDGGVYNVTDADGNYYKAIYNHDEERTEVVANKEFAADKDEYNWLATVNADGTVSLSHDITLEESENPRSRAAVTTLTHYLVENAAPAYDGYGNATLGEMNVQAAVRADNPNTTTTSISEVESWSEGSEAIFDLQGRRLAAPVKGINIIGGRKVLVK